MAFGEMTSDNAAGSIFTKFGGYGLKMTLFVLELTHIFGCYRLEVGQFLWTLPDVQIKARGVIL